METRPDLPEEIMIEIFSWLPVKSIGKFRSLSKAWRNNLSTRNFIKSHLLRQKTRRQQDNLILTAPSLSIHPVETIKNARVVSSNLILPGAWDRVVGSCDGLVLLSNDDDVKVILVNPVTLEQAKIPDSPLALDRGKRSLISYGFGYDSLRDDYKVVTLSCYANNLEDDPRGTDMYVDVYSVKTGIWKRLESSNYSYGHPDYCQPGVFLNGTIHWMVGREIGHDQELVAFDLGNEMFFKIPLPVNADNKDDRAFRVAGRYAALGGCLCVIYTSKRILKETELWIMKEHGVVESWAKFNIYGYGFWEFIRPLCFVGDEGEVVLVVCGSDHLVVYNLKEGTTMDLTVDGFLGYEFDYGDTFLETLVSPAAAH